MSDEHVYGLDGIKEENNRFPLWLGFCYVVLHIWGIYYLVNFWVMPGDQIRSEVVNTSLGEVTYANLTERNAMPEIPYFTEEHVTKGKEVFTRVYGSETMAAEYLKYGSSVGSLTGAVRDGIQGTALPPWQDVLTDEEIVSMVAYLDSLNPDRHEAPKDAHGGKQEAAHGDEETGAAHGEETADHNGAAENPENVAQDDNSATDGTTENTDESSH